MRRGRGVDHAAAVGRVTSGCGVDHAGDTEVLGVVRGIGGRLASAPAIGDVLGAQGGGGRLLGDVQAGTAVVVASTRSILHSGQIAETMSTSSDSSSVQSSSAGAVAGSGEVSPSWLYWVNWPDVRAGSPAADRYVARSLAAVGSL